MSSETPIPREHYMERIRWARDTPFIKVLTGIRRCGKSTLLNMFIDELRASGIDDDRIFSVNLDDEGCGIGTYTDLISAVESHITAFEGSYIFLDEVQNIPEWERAVSTFYVRKADVYITGSNSNMLSSELATKLSGRTLEIPVRPLVFSEYVRFRRIDDRQRLFGDYIRYGGFPAVALMMDRMPSQIPSVLEGIYNTVFNKDVAGRHEIRGTATISNLCRYMMRNIGDRTSARGAAEYLTSKGLRTQPATIEQYIGFLEEAMLFSRAKRLDSKTKEYLRTADKYYASDLGIRNILVPFTPNDLDGILENVVYNELCYRCGGAVVVSVGNTEVDFMTEPPGPASYYQVSVSVANPETLERELRSLRALDDNYPKTVVTMERYPIPDVGGIAVREVIEWLLEE